jgi:hypothetical protein
MPVALRRGFTLPDLLVGLLLLSLVATLAVRMTLMYGRVLRGQRERAGLQSAFTAGFSLLSADLGDIAPGDLSLVSPDLMQYRALRASGLACSLHGTEVLVLLDRFASTRLPQAGRDSLLVYFGGSRSASSVDEWLLAPVAGVTRTTCDGRPALRLTTALDSTRLRDGAPPALVPIRTFEVMQARLYSSLGAWWLGVRSVSAGETFQPVAGPFEGAGSQFRYFDSAGAGTLVPVAVRAISITLSGRAAGWNGVPAALRDSAQLVLHPVNLWP